MGEHSAWSSVRAHLKSIGAHIQRLEDKLTPGVPDTNFCLRSAEVWFEGKFLKEYPTRPNTPVRVGLRPEQATWLENRCLAGGICYVWIREPSCWRLVPNGIDFPPYNNWRALQHGVPFSQWHAFGIECKTSGELVETLIARLKALTIPSILVL